MAQPFWNMLTISPVLHGGKLQLYMVRLLASMFVPVLNMRAHAYASVSSVCACVRCVVFPAIAATP